MSPHNLYAVALRIMAIWFLSLGMISVLSLIAGPLATLIYGVILLLYATFQRPFAHPGEIDSYPRPQG